jgi:hypothetical protein
VGLQLGEQVGLQRYNKFIVAAVAVAFIFLNNEDVALANVVSDNLAAVLGALGVFAVPNRPS